MLSLIFISLKQNTSPECSSAPTQGEQKAGLAVSTAALLARGTQGLFCHPPVANPGHSPSPGTRR